MVKVNNNEMRNIEGGASYALRCVKCSKIITGSGANTLIAMIIANINYSNHLKRH